MSTLVLTRSDVVRHLDALHLLADLRDAFRADALARTVVPHRAQAPVNAEGSALAAFPGAIPGVPAYSVRVRFSGPAAPGPGVVHLHDMATGELLAVMDAGHLGRLCAGVAAALAADVLARPDASRVACVGAGPLAPVLLKCLRLVRTLSHVRVYDASAPEAAAFAARMYATLSLPVRTAATVAGAVEDADIVLTARRPAPALPPQMVPPGTHVSTQGGLEQAAGGVGVALLARAKLVCDHRGLTLGQAAAGGADADVPVIHAELGEVIAGLRTGRTRPDELTAFAAAGTPLVDLAAAWQVYQLARQDTAVKRVDFRA
jgi:ornithine cyclodeaminase